MVCHRVTAVAAGLAGTQCVCAEDGPQCKLANGQ